MNLTAKLGPLPVWVWGLIIGGFAVVWMWVSQRNQTAATVTPAETVGTTPNGPGGDFSQVPALPSGTVTQDVTNAQWLTQAVNAVVNNGVATALAAQTALQKYLGGETLSLAEGTLVNIAISSVGLPPQGSGTPVVTPSESEITETARQTLAGRVRTWFQTYLGRDITQSSALERVDTGASAAELERQIRDSQEAAMRKAVILGYRQFLGREPSAQDITYWMGTGKTPDAITAAIRESPEAVARR